MSDYPLNMDYTPEAKIKNGVVQYKNPNDAFMGVVKDFLEDAKVVSRKGRLYLSLKPKLFGIADLSDTMITLPGSNYHDPIPWLFAELFDWLSGPLVAGGQSSLFDKHRRTVYPRANGEDDWGYKSAFGLVEGEGQLDWARRHLRMDPSSRSCVISPWKVTRDLIKYTSRKELEINKGEEYQRLPCIASIQLTTDDTSESKKGLQSMVHQRALDFTGAAHTDIFRIAESQHWCAVCSMPNGYTGSMTVMAGTCVIESYGAARFQEFHRLMEWWSSDPKLLGILDGYERNNICEQNQKLTYTPATKTYEWFFQQWQKTEISIYNAIKNQWGLFEQRVADIKYEYWRDYTYSMACFWYLLRYEMLPEISAYHWDAKSIKSATDWSEQLGEYPPFYWLKKINNWMAYYVTAELARKFIADQNWSRLDELWSLTEQTKKFKYYMLTDSSRFLNKRQMDKLWLRPEYKQFGELWAYLFKGEEA